MNTTLNGIYGRVKKIADKLAHNADIMNFIDRIELVEFKDKTVDDWTFNKYQQEALVTGVNCPLVGSPVCYPLLGMIGETGEVYEKITEICKKNTEDLWKYPQRAEVIKEMGDVLWYISITADRLGLKLEELSQSEWMRSYYNRFKKDRCWSLKSEVAECLQELVVCEGKLTERIKKVFRDGNGEFVGERKVTIIDALMSVLDALTKLAYAMSIDLPLIADTNISKIRSRQERNTLQGEGDNR